MSRDPFTLIFGILQPIVFLVLYGPLLVGMAGAGGESPWQWFVPGIIVMVGLFGTSVAGAYLLEELRVGSFERFLVTPLDRSSLLIGRALKEVVPLDAPGASSSSRSSRRSASSCTRSGSSSGC